jgi:hypothetical protein
MSRSPLVVGNTWETNSIIYVFDLRAGEPTYIEFVNDEEVDRVINAAASIPEPALPTTIQPLNTTPEPTAPPPTLAPVQK